jgi:hypothetical protein
LQLGTWKPHIDQDQFCDVCRSLDFAGLFQTDHRSQILMETVCARSILSQMSTVRSGVRSAVYSFRSFRLVRKLKSTKNIAASTILNPSTWYLSAADYALCGTKTKGKEAEDAVASCLHVETRGRLFHDKIVLVLSTDEDLRDPYTDHMPFPP